MNNTVKDSAIKKLKLLITVVDRPKGEFYLDVLGQYNVNFQMVTNGQGTANSQLLELLGLEPHKAVILSVVREDLVGEIREVTARIERVVVSTLTMGMAESLSDFLMEMEIDER